MKNVCLKILLGVTSAQPSTQEQAGVYGHQRTCWTATPSRIFLGIHFLLVIVLCANCNKDKKPENTNDLPVVSIDVPVIETFSIDTSVLRPILADPAQVLDYPAENWRSADYEIFSWDVFAGSSPILIFDYANYAVQDRMLKRLAFFVEKIGFHGRLASDSEIKDLHGWNAHDYRAQDLAGFFNLAREQQFPLLDEEWELELILLNEKIIRAENGSIVPGKGAIISISRESPDYLRRRFMAHEGFHALYFIDEDFRSFCRLRWDNLQEGAKRFLIAYFLYQQYDTKNNYLIINEFLGHVLQQPVSQVADYFGRNLPSRLENTRHASELPKKDAATGTWPELAEAFTQEAQALSEYVGKRWGLAAGRVWKKR